LARHKIVARFFCIVRQPAWTKVPRAMKHNRGEKFAPEISASAAREMKNFATAQEKIR